MKTKLGKLAVVVLSLSLVSMFFCSIPAKSDSPKWKAGYRMGFKIKPKTLEVAIKEDGPTISFGFEFIDCCVRDNMNTACNFASQNTRC